MVLGREWRKIVIAAIDSYFSDLSVDNDELLAKMMADFYESVS